jgi:hypothetical protein
MMMIAGSRILEHASAAPPRNQVNTEATDGSAYFFLVADCFKAIAWFFDLVALLAAFCFWPDFLFTAFGDLSPIILMLCLLLNFLSSRIIVSLKEPYLSH